MHVGTIGLEYTKLKTKDHGSYEIADGFDSDTNYIKTPLVTSIYHFNYTKVTMNLDYNIFDLELERPYYLGRKLIFKPYFGLRAGWIDQKFEAAVRFIIDDDVFVTNYGLGVAKEYT